ncbi:DUF2505 domain-containing protein [Actinomyces sp. zg296]|uniref:DUF2505 domain-containing protein n=1 Tax=Actinomyces sp. zg296 TaxID=2609289 RepID=UPI00135C3C8D|nr:DUF2505 domain-containing protein [Actinomyces sp. zg296]
MRKTVTITYPADPARVATMLADPEYQRGRVARLGSGTVTSEVTAQGDGFSATASGTVPADSLPSAARRLVRSGVSFTVTEAWGGPAEDGSRTGTLSIDAGGAPVRSSGALTMRPSGGQTVVEVDLELKVTVPLVGRAIEDKAMSMAGRVIADEESRAATWLGSH